ncbi:hypothetical protein [Streptomyces sp. V1I6]|uniref:hypothetical protein n=1 Tax=unclassified Streptomyces TaxID=2593676 RepID=UPI00278A5728|nr:hypothetical protein [Streptomyces sp. V1I6]MDQ0840883.1 hypothetical protein [Streptomyces sp. V1I6]
MSGYSRTSGNSGASGTCVSAASALHCPHGGRAFAAGASSAVLVDGQPVRTASDVFVVAGCAHTVNGVPRPCTSVRFSPPERGVLVDGVAVLLDTTAAQCFDAALVPQGPAVVSGARQGVVCG